MEFQALTWEDILRSLQERLGQSHEPVIIKARIAITTQETRLLDVQSDCSLDTIRY